MGTVPWNHLTLVEVHPQKNIASELSFGLFLIIFHLRSCNTSKHILSSEDMQKVQCSQHMFRLKNGSAFGSLEVSQLHHSHPLATARAWRQHILETLFWKGFSQPTPAKLNSSPKRKKGRITALSVSCSRDLLEIYVDLSLQKIYLCYLRL